MTTRLVAAFVGLAALVVAVFVIPLGLNFQTDRNGDLAAAVERDAFVMASLSRESVARRNDAGRRAIAEIGERYEAETGGRVIVTGPGGGLLFDSAPLRPGPRDFSSRPEIATALDGHVATGRRFSKTLGRELLVVAVPVASEGQVFGAVRISFPTDEVNREVRDYWLQLAFLAIVMIAASALVGVVLARWVTGPLTRLTRVTADFGRGDLSRRAAPRDGPPEVRELARSFNLMSDQIERLVDSQDRFVAHASHQLRTPLAALTLQLDNLALQSDDPSLVERVEGLIGETSRLSAVIDALLSLARASEEPPQLVSVDVAQVVAERVRSLQPRARQAGVSLSSTAHAIDVAVVDGGLDQMLDNLIDNAIVATPAGGSVAVANTVSKTTVELQVVDSGVGLSQEERARAFDRFWRGRREPGGSGLGLAIVKRLAEAGGGTARLDPAPGGGTIATLVLRRASINEQSSDGAS